MNTPPYILTIDQGTTSSRAIIFSHDAHILCTKQKELKQHYPAPGWVEHDANDIWQDTLYVTQEAIKQVGGADKIAVIGITNQRETTIVWNRQTGKPVHKAIVWQDRRTADFCETLRDKGMEDMISSKTGLLIDPYFSASKIKWVLDNVAGTRELAARGDLAFGSVECFLLWKLTGGKSHISDTTNASRTGLYNIIENKWDDALLAIYGIPRSILPEVLDNVADFGTTDPAVFGAAINIGGMAGDQSAALIGQCCFDKGMIKSTYGTGCFALMNIGTDFKRSQNRLLTTPAYRMGGRTHYAIEGSIFMAGAIVQWLRDELGIITHAAQSEDLATSIADNDDVYLLPAFTGLGAPHWQPQARAAIVGLTRGSGKAHIARAALEAQAYQTMDLLGAMEKDSGIRPQTLRVDGGLVANQFVCQFLADITRCTIDVPQNTETTALGACFLAGLYAGIYNDLDHIRQSWRADKSFSAHMNIDKRDGLYETWTGYIQALV